MAAAAAISETAVAANEFLAFVNASPSPFHGASTAAATHNCQWASD